MYKILSERGHKSTSTTHQRVRDTRFTAETVVQQAQAKKLVESARTKPSRTMITIFFGIYLSFMISSTLCVHGPQVIHNKHFEPTLLSSNIRPILFEFRDLQYNQHNMELRYILILAKTRNRGTQRQFLENICSEDDLISRIFGTFVVKFLVCLPLLGFSNI